MENYSSIVILQLLGERVKNYRIDYPMMQKELADRSGVSLRSIQNFESGKDIQMSNVVKILKALELEDNLDLLVPDVTKKPSMYLEKQKRVRVRKAKEEKNSEFHWGDEA